MGSARVSLHAVPLPAESALKEKAEYLTAAKSSSREGDKLYKAECAARVAAEERALAAEARLAALEQGAGGAAVAAPPAAAAVPSLCSCTTAVPCLAGIAIGAILVVR